MIYNEKMCAFLASLCAANKICLTRYVYGICFAQVETNPEKENKQNYTNDKKKQMALGVWDHLTFQ